MDPGAIEVDGRLDDAAWRTAEPGANFQMHEPDRGANPTEQTIFKVAYDTDALYFAVACLESDPSKITAHLSRRDRFSDSDLVSIYVDPYHDKTTGYNFRVNPLGVQEDSYLYNDGERDTNWDAVWQSEIYRDESGWYAELRIPFSSVRYRRGSDMTWGLQVYRYMHGRGEDTGWVTPPREVPGFISQFGTLTGLREVPAPRQMEIVPYVVHRSDDPAALSGDRFEHAENFGADLKYGVSEDLTLNATVNPDFGQVEADPAQLNLSPFETFFEEKRPFFVEGNRFFELDGFNQFYSRRIGTGDLNSRIRYAGKLTGKISGSTTLAALVAGTDVAGDGQQHNLLKSGAARSNYFVGRLGKEWADGRRQFGVMQTAVRHDGSRAEYGDRGSRESYTTGADFRSYFSGRDWSVDGGFIGTVIDPEPIPGAPASSVSKKYGTGGTLGANRNAGNIRGSVYGRWEGDKLDLNDMGFLSAPDAIGAGAWMQIRRSSKNDQSRIVTGNVNFNLNLDWLYAARSGYDARSGEKIWSYGRAHVGRPSTNVNGWIQFRSRREFYYGLNYMPAGTQRFETRGGPLIGEPETLGGWIGGSTDTRKNLVVSGDFNYFADVAKNVSIDCGGSLSWNQSSALRHTLHVGYGSRIDDTQFLEKVDLADRPGGVGIGGISYLFGDIDQETINVTLRSNLLLNRDQSLEVYLQPFQTVGRYRRLRELAVPDSYKLTPYREEGLAPADYDFNYAELNLNAVYRWQYRPGSTLYLVWTQNRQHYAERNFYPGGLGYQGNLAPKDPFGVEPANVFLAKVTYYLPI